MTISCLALNCSLKRRGSVSSTDKLLGELLAEMAHLGVTGEIVRVADFDIKPGVTARTGRRGSTGGPA